MPFQHLFHGRHGNLKLPQAFHLIHDNELRMLCDNIPEPLDAVHAGPGLGVFQQSDLSPRGIGHQMLRALDTRLIIVGHHGACHKAVILDAGIDGNDGHSRLIGRLERRFHFLPVHGIDKDELRAALDELLHLGNLPIH